MVNRTIIRLKVVQLLYEHYQSGRQSVQQTLKDLLKSLDLAHELYMHMLLLIVAVTRAAQDEADKREELARVAHSQVPIDRRLADNQFAAQLSENKQLVAFREKHADSWALDRAYLRLLLADIEQSPAYRAYRQQSQTDYEGDRELWRRLYKQVIMPDQRIDDILEDTALFWNDDRPIIDTFVLKTIKQFDPRNGARQPLQPQYRTAEADEEAQPAPGGDTEPEDERFAIELLKQSIARENELRGIIKESVRGWDFERLALMDIVTMQAALAEILVFPLIPVSVTINEYVEIAKCYSTPRSPGYINGILDAVARRFFEKGIINKDF